MYYNKSRFGLAAMLMVSCFLGSTDIYNAVAQSTTNVATLLIYTDVPWQGNIGTSSNSTSINGNMQNILLSVITMILIP